MRGSNDVPGSATVDRRGAEALLLLADGRLPTGGYAHSGGLESAVRTGRIADIADLGRFLTGRATTIGAVAAAFAAAACSAVTDERLDTVPLLDDEFRARTPSPALRTVSETLGRQLLRAMTAIHPHEVAQRIPSRLNHPVAFGAAAAMLGLDPLDAARGVLHETVMSPAMAVVKLMSVDPFEAHRTLAALIGLLDEISAEAAGYSGCHPAGLPAYGAPLSDLLAEHHVVAEVRLFAS